MSHDLAARKRRTSRAHRCVPHETRFTGKGTSACRPMADCLVQANDGLVLCVFAASRILLTCSERVRRGAVQEKPADGDASRGTVAEAADHVD